MIKAYFFFCKFTIFYWLMAVATITQQENTVATMTIILGCGAAAINWSNMVLVCVGIN